VTILSKAIDIIVARRMGAFEHHSRIFKKELQDKDFIVRTRHEKEIAERARTLGVFEKYRELAENYLIARPDKVLDWTLQRVAKHG